MKTKYTSLKLGFINKLIIKIQILLKSFRFKTLFLKVVRYDHYMDD